MEDLSQYAMQVAAAIFVIGVFGSLLIFFVLVSAVRFEDWRNARTDKKHEETIFVKIEEYRNDFQ